MNVFTYQGEVKIESKITFDDVRLERRDFERVEEYYKERDLDKARAALKSYCGAVSSKFKEGNMKCQHILELMETGGNAMNHSKDYVERKKKELDHIIDEIRMIQESNAGSNVENSSKRQRTQ